jgi:hypothetical protein
VASSAGGPPPTVRREQDLTLRSRAATVSFAELVRAHALVVRSTKDSARQEEAARNYESVLAAFARAHGPIVEEFWTEDGASAAVLTGGRRRAFGRLLKPETPPRLHVHSDASSESPPAAELQHRCLELAIRASVLLVGTQRQIAMRLVFGVAVRVLMLAGMCRGCSLHCWWSRSG